MDCPKFFTEIKRDLGSALESYAMLKEIFQLSLIFEAILNMIYTKIKIG